MVAFLDVQPGDLGADVGADVDLGIGLDLAGAVDLLDDLRALGHRGLDLLGLGIPAFGNEVAAATDDHHGNGDHGKESALFHRWFPWI